MLNNLMTNSVIFDFDSTLVTVETLEKVLNYQGQLTDQQLNQLSKITDDGMNGIISFHESLYRRLDIAQPTKQACHAIAKTCFNEWLTPGIKGVIFELQAQGNQIWIISGGLEDVIKPVARELGIPSENIRGIKIKWDSHGNYIGLQENNPFNHSKVKGADQIKSKLGQKSIIIGDGFTDLALYSEGICSHFIAFTQNVNRQDVVDQSPSYAFNTLVLRQELLRLGYL